MCLWVCNYMHVCVTNLPGVSQNSQTSGPLGTMETVGNLRRISLNSANQTGSWEIRIISTEPYTLKVIGQQSPNVK